MGRVAEGRDFFPGRVRQPTDISHHTATERTAMHELGIAQNILRIVLAQAAKNNVKQVMKVRIKAGELRGIVPHFLSFHFDFVTKDTIAEGASLHVETVPVRGKCGDCQAEFPVENYQFVCPDCGGKDIDTVTGMELMVQEIEAL